MFSFLIFDISGFAVIICYYSDKFLFCLYYKSPNARDKLKSPFILSNETYPAIFLILSNSVLQVYDSLTFISLLHLYERFLKNLRN
jgi:hypothetical protein